MTDQTQGTRREQARKITIATVSGGAKAFFPRLMVASFEKTGVDAQGNDVLKLKDTPPVLPLVKIIGYINGAKPGMSDNGEFIKFLGNFRGTNLATGEQLDGPVMIVPNYLADSLYAAVQDTNRVGPIQIALEFGARYDESAVAKYVFVCHDLLPRGEADPLSLLENAVNTGQGLLTAAPASAAALAPAPAPTQAPAPAPTEAPKAQQNSNKRR